MSNTKWYEDENLVNLSRKCDEVYFDQDEEGMCILVDECYRQAHDLKNTNMIRARYFYISFTIQSDLIDLKRKKSRNNYKDSIKSLKLYETDFQKSLYLARNAFELLANEMEEDNNISQNELIYMISFQWQLSVNYANFFYQNGRLVKAVEILSIFNSKNVFPMGMAQLGMKLYELACCHYDGGQRTIMLYKAYHYIKQAIESDEPFPEKAEMNNLLNYYSNNIISMLGHNYLDKAYTIRDFLYFSDDMSVEATKYWEWVAKNKLALNLLNDVFDSVEVGYDPLYLPSMSEDIEGKKVQYLFGLFNQIKQEYVSARFLAYEGFNTKEPHFSDKRVYLINTLDYPIYGIGIEKIKACYRAVYSVFDKIAFFLNEYFEIGIKKNIIGYVRLFSPDKNANDKIRILDIAENNYPLFGMWWLFKDVRNININEDGTVNKKAEYKHIDNVMTKISKVRNAMEHGYLKIIDTYCKELFIDDSRLDKLAYNISFEDYEKLTLQLLKYVREAIVLLVFSVKREEEIKESHRSSDEILAPMYTDKYDDEWKHIY